MKNILVLGAGLSASSLIRYLLENSTEYNWKVRIVDQNIETVKAKIKGHANGIALSFDALNPDERRPEIEQSDLVISMLPARFHIGVAQDCISLKTNLITPSYISDEMRALNTKAKDAGIVIMNEIGVDPGIDHMSAMKIINEIKERGGQLTSFKSFTGGLIAPESDDNPWNYKFTWNPRNVILAGQGGAASFLRNGRHKYIPYNRLFGRLDHMSVDGYGDFVGYANRDSLSYRETYGIQDIPTLFRGTLRRPGYCKAWDVFIELGMTDDSYQMANTANLTPRTFLNSFLPYNANVSVEEKFKVFLREDRIDTYDRFEWLGLFQDEPIIGVENASPAQVLQKILVNKLSLNDGDKDMLVMIHEFEYELNGSKNQITSSMVNIGEDQVFTSMSNTVGLPVAICAKMILLGELKSKGVTLPVQKEVYTPILKELESYDIRFLEKEIKLG
ncbi:saccharopine dehydrogenase NADP-binding domain-containing protein [Crocinitomicaceae bacterium]|jgi:saccharopine dehydrogenase-like NADP-dependent oxidoreductase|nr:saccharopine dehydrogenase NADP-binding domain-containing protein [Crocinitomicaceae bacterium]MDG1037052.1 saccharopine dehydrogenase C-terminal domain-containing protein [Crocinitomicaceae bacterium]